MQTVAPQFPAIEHIKQPEMLKPYLAHLDAHNAQITEEDVPLMVEAGTVPGWFLPEHLRYEHIVYVLVTALNDVIDSLNVLIADMEDLPQRVPHLKGKPSKRVELIVRSFLAEFFRGREVSRNVSDSCVVGVSSIGIGP